ncbi:hypothetical protein ACE3MZ_07225 [Paenibacillus sp. WLX1005]|uniref:hypothetical protein n=1 Tax=unclassified Paenibacillus TaxID=185978 RepID=UPI0039844080
MNDRDMNNNNMHPGLHSEEYVNELHNDHRRRLLHPRGFLHELSNYGLAVLLIAAVLLAIVWLR